MKLSLSVSCFLIYLTGFSQAPNNQEKIKILLQDYFRLEREIIHVQFTKTTYLNNEDLAFKGYVISKNTNLPNLNTSNVQLVIYDEQEQIVQKKLLYTSNGTFAGGIHLNEKFKTGKYLFHFYTNWMNNFKEDDSFSQTIEIYNIDESFNNKSKEPNWKTVKVEFFPEGGNIIDGISNTIGVKITDCNNKGIELNNISVLDSKSNEISHFSTNKMGNGEFYMIADANEKYTLKTQSEKLSIAQQLPGVKQTGISISYNNNLPKNILAVAVKTNEKGIELYQNKKFNLLIQQNGSSIIKEINFNNKEKDQIIVLEKKYLPNGVSCIRLIDEELNEITARLIYNYATIEPDTKITAKEAVDDNIILTGSTNLVQTNISASILPENTICAENKRSMLGTFYLNTYLETPEIDNYIYFDPENKYKKRDMDLLMLNQNQSKYIWENIKSNPPQVNYKFNKGVTISGNINRSVTPNSTNKLLLISIKDNLFEKTNVAKDNSFRFDNFFVQDSTVYILQLENEKKSSVFTKMVAKVYNHETKFNLPLKFNKSNCPLETTTGESIIFSDSKLSKNAINLNEITIVNKFKKEVFTHRNEMSINAQAFKIDDSQFGTALDFIGRNGYQTGIDEDNTAYIRSTRDSFEGNPPAVFIDNFQVVDYNLLYSLNLSNVDEIYIDKSGISDTTTDSSGTIKIYQKIGADNKYLQSEFTTLIATNGYSKNIGFKPTPFDIQEEFDSFGTLNWSPNITTKENQNFEFKFPKGNQKVIQVFIQGFSTNGQLISEIKKIPVESL